MLRANGSKVVLTHEFETCFDLLQPLRGQAISKPLIQEIYENCAVQFDKAVAAKMRNRSVDFFVVELSSFTKASRDALSGHIKWREQRLIDATKDKERLQKTYDDIPELMGLRDVMLKNVQDGALKNIQKKIDVAKCGLYPAFELSDIVRVWDDVCDAEYTVDESLRRGQGQNTLTVLQAFNNLSDYRDRFYCDSAGPKKKKDRNLTKADTGKVSWGGLVPVG